MTQKIRPAERQQETKRKKHSKGWKSLMQLLMKILKKLAPQDAYTVMKSLLAMFSVQLIMVIEPSGVQFGL